MSGVNEIGKPAPSYLFGLKFKQVTHAIEFGRNYTQEFLALQRYYIAIAVWFPEGMPDRQRLPMNCPSEIVFR